MRFASLVVGSLLLLSGTARAAYLANITIDGNAGDWSTLFQFRDRNENATAAGGGTVTPIACFGCVRARTAACSLSG